MRIAQLVSEIRVIAKFFNCSLEEAMLFLELDFQDYFHSYYIY